MERISHPRYLIALVLGLLATVALYLPPLEIATRVDRALYDTWSSIDLPNAPQNIVLVQLDDPSWLTTLAAIAGQDGAQLLIATIPQPPSELANRAALGPMELPLSSNLLRRTQWQSGGHLWFRPDLDGVVRHDWAVIEGGTPIQSLGLSAALALIDKHKQHDPAAPGITDIYSRYKLDRSGRSWLRFYEPGSFNTLSPADLLASQGQLTNRIVIAGDGEASFPTPIGQLTAPALVAQALAGYLDDNIVQASLYGHLPAWLIALSLLTWLTLAQSAGATLRRAVPIGVAGGLPIVSGAGFLALGLWLPVTGPIVLLLITAGIGALQPRKVKQSSEESDRVTNSDRVRARRLAALGRLEEAWDAYRNIPPSTELLNELYELGGSFEAQGRTEHAAAVFHRIAQTDVRFKDAAQRLAANNHTSSVSPASEPALTPIDKRPDALGRYELLEEIGQGGTGQVFLGRDPKINRIVAIKVINLSAECEVDELAETSARFQREAQTAGRLNHPNIVTVFDVGEAQGLAYIAMEYLKGRHLSDHIDPETLLPVRVVLELLARTADALHYAHTQNVVHRDIKPANIMYDSLSDTLKITDFGIARSIDVSRTRTGIILGTPSFMAPEQLKGENVNRHTDLFALGVSLYQLLTGRLPFRGASMTQLMFVIANEPHQPVTVIRPRLPEQLNTLFDTALAKTPTDRFDTGADMANALREIAGRIV